MPYIFDVSGALTTVIKGQWELEGVDQASGMEIYRAPGYEAEVSRDGNLMSISAGPSNENGRISKSEAGRLISSNGGRVSSLNWRVTNLQAGRFVVLNFDMERLEGTGLEIFLSNPAPVHRPS